ncbi:MAG: hypothetical protein IJD45_02090 [Clostridia bacterium]|nr:hypothetical protein [Clostridia bacterium]
MKKVFLILALGLFLCGCQKRGPEYLVSSMGFDKENDSYKVCFESVIINSEDTKQSVKLLKGEGKTLRGAIMRIEKQCTQPLLLSHCGVLVIGDGITQNELSEVAKYCVKNEEITLSAFLIKTENAQQLLSVKPVSSLTVGFDIMGLLEQNKHYKNRLFELTATNYTAALPRVSINDGGLIFGAG